MKRRILLIGLAIWSITPLALLVVVSFAGGWRFPTLLGEDPGLAAWRSLGAGPLARAAWTSLAIGVGTGLGAAGAGLLAGRALARGRGWSRTLGVIFAFLPVATPPLLLGIGLQFTFLRAGLGGTAAGVWLAHLVPAVGYTTLYFVGIFTSWEFGIERAARQLGATRRQTLVRVIAPLLRRPLAEAALLGFLVSWAQVPLTLLVGQGRVRSLTVEVLSFVQAGQDGLAAAGALVLLLPPLLLIALATWGVREAEVVIA